MFRAQGEALAAEVRRAGPLIDFTDRRSTATLDALWERASAEVEPAFTKGSNALLAAAYMVGVQRFATETFPTRAREAVAFRAPPRIEDVVIAGRGGWDGTTFGLTNKRAGDWLAYHAARLVAGVDDTTRSRLHGIVEGGRYLGQSSEKIAATIISVFPDMAEGRPQEHIDSRAHGIAVTEAAFAYEAGQRDVAQHVASQGVPMQKAWLTVGDDRVDEDCEQNEDADWIGVDEPFPSGDSEPPAHPYCRCTTEYRVDPDWLEQTDAPDLSAPAEPEAPVVPDTPTWAERPFTEVRDAAASSEADFTAVLRERYGIREVEVGPNLSGEGLLNSPIRNPIGRRYLTEGFETWREQGIDTGSLCRKVRFVEEERIVPIGTSGQTGRAAADMSMGLDRTMRIYPQRSSAFGKDLIEHELGHAFDAQFAQGSAFAREWETLFTHTAGSTGRTAKAITSQLNGTRKAIKSSEEAIDYLQGQLADATRNALSPEAVARYRRLVEDHTTLIAKHRDMERGLLAMREEAKRAAKVLGTPEEYVSHYASTSVYEDLAESVQKWLTDRAAFSAKHPKRADLIGRMFKAAAERGGR